MSVCIHVCICVCICTQRRPAPFLYRFDAGINVLGTPDAVGFRCVGRGWILGGIRGRLCVYVMYVWAGRFIVDRSIATIGARVHSCDRPNRGVFLEEKDATAEAHQQQVGIVLVWFDVLVSTCVCYNGLAPCRSKWLHPHIQHVNNHHIDRPTKKNNTRQTA